MTEKLPSTLQTLQTPQTPQMPQTSSKTLTPALFVCCGITHGSTGMPCNPLVSVVDPVTKAEMLVVSSRGRD